MRLLEQRLEAEKSKFEKVVYLDKEYIQLCIQTQTEGFLVPINLFLQFPESSLYALFCGRHAWNLNDKKQFVMDRDPDTFRDLIKVLRASHLKLVYVKTAVHKAKLLEEIDFWCLPVDIEIKVEEEIQMEMQLQIA